MVSINWQRFALAILVGSQGALYALSHSNILSDSTAIGFSSVATFLAGVLTVLRPGQRVPGLSRTA